MIGSIYNSYGVYGSSSLNGLFSNYAAMNNLKLNQILSRSDSKSSSYSSSLGGSSVLSTDSVTFLKSYQSKMTNMLEKANALRETNKSNPANKMSASVSDSKVLSLTSKYTLTEPAKYTVNVKQLATAQKNKSAGFNSGEKTVGGSLTLVTNQGRKDFDVGRIASGAANNREALQSLADEINKSKVGGQSLGVTARVVEDAGESRLELDAISTGSVNNFIASGSFAETSGLNQAAQRGQDAVYTVSKAGAYSNAEFRSATNSVNIGNYKLQANFKETGTSEITVGPDLSSTGSAIKDLVDSYNSTLKFLNDNGDRGTGVLRQIRRMVLPPTSEKSMERIGVTVNKDGTLNFDEATFKKNASANPSLVKDIVSGSHGFAEGIYNDAKDGLKASSSSLISSDIQDIRNESTYSPLNVMSMYSKSGVYNMMNYYAVGALMNLNV